MIIAVSILLILKAMNDDESEPSDNKPTVIPTRELTSKEKYINEISKNVHYGLKVADAEELEDGNYNLILEVSGSGMQLSNCIEVFTDALPSLNYSLNTKKVSLTCKGVETINLSVENYQSVEDKKYTFYVEEPGKEGRIVTKEQLEQEKINDYKNSCTTVNSREALRYPDKYKGTKARWFGEIVQVVSKSSNYSEFRVSVDCVPYQYIGGYNCENTIYVQYYGSESFIEDDMVNMWGTMQGNYTYTTVMNASMTIPKFRAEYMELAN